MPEPKGVTMRHVEEVSRPSVSGCSPVSARSGFRSDKKYAVRQTRHLAWPTRFFTFVCSYYGVMCSISLAMRPLGLIGMHAKRNGCLALTIRSGGLTSRTCCMRADGMLKNQILTATLTVT